MGVGMRVDEVEHLVVRADTKIFNNKKLLPKNLKKKNTQRSNFRNKSQGSQSQEGI